MDGYLDFGSDSDNDDSPNEFGGQAMDVDSDEEERNQNDQILKMLMEKSDSSYAKSKKEKAIDDFEAEMEAELDKRALQIESEGGLQHQQSFSRSSSSSSLNKLGLDTPAPRETPLVGVVGTTGATSGPGSSSSKRPRTALKDPQSKTASPSLPKKSVKFSEEPPSIAPQRANDPAPTLPIPIPPGPTSPCNEVPTKPTGEGGPKPQYEEIYFDSDESEGDDDATRKTRRNKRDFLTNDDLFYDPKSDTRDQEWVDKKRRQYYVENKLVEPNSNSASGVPGPGAHFSKKENSSKSALADDILESSKKKPMKLPPGVKPLPTSDAVLNCPACFTVLCLDCQRHEFYNNQYRAMFVMNCVVNSDEVIYAPEKQRKSKSRTNKHQSYSTVPTDDIKDKFNTVKCQVCSTQIGVYDHDEVYHFNNVLASHS